MIAEDRASVATLVGLSWNTNNSPRPLLGTKIFALSEIVLTGVCLKEEAEVTRRR